VRQTRFKIVARGVSPWILLAILVYLSTLRPTLAFAVEPCNWGFESSAASMPSPRGRAVGVAVRDYFYVIGGVDNGQPSDKNEAYLPVRDEWVSLAPLPRPLGNSCGAAIGDVIYVLGGLADGNYYADFLAYDIEDNAWHRQADFPYGVGGSACAALDGRFYAAGGETETDIISDLYVYDPDADAWTQLASMPMSVSFARGGGYQGKFYVVGGWNSASNFAYDPQTDTWDELAPIPVVAHDAPLILPLHSDSHYFWLFGTADDWVVDPTIRRYYTDENAWVIAASFGYLPFTTAAPAAANFHDALFLLAGGWDDYPQKLQVFRYCAPYAGPLEPQSADNCTPTAITIPGLHFDDQPGSEFYLESSDGRRADLAEVQVWSSRNATAVVPEGLPPGNYDLVVTNSAYEMEFNTQRRTDAFEVKARQPNVEAVIPDEGYSGDLIDVTITGHHFFGDTEVRLTDLLAGDVEASAITVVDEQTISCYFDLNDTPAGDYDVEVVTANGS